MKKKKKGSFFKIFIILLLLSVLGIGAYLYFTNPSQLSEILKIEKKEDILDTYNGLYVYSDSLNKSYNIYYGCSVSKLDHYILVMDDKYYTYDSTCMSTYYKDSGETKSLKFSINKESNNYLINFDDHEYLKSYSINQVVPGNRVSKNISTISLDSVSLIIKNTEFEGEYYDIISPISFLDNKNLLFNFKKIDEGYNISFTNANETLYSYTFTNYDRIPVFYNYYSGIVILENNSKSESVNYDLKVLDTDNGILYNLDDMFPITIDGNKISPEDYNVLIHYDKSTSIYKIFFSKNEKICVENSESDDIAYYIFETKYDSALKNVSRPSFVEYVKEKDGCSKFNKILEG